jgi:hypothetical protein
MATPSAALPPRPWESGERSTDSAERDLGVDRPWSRAGGASGTQPVSSAPTPTSASSASSEPTTSSSSSSRPAPSDDAFLLYDLLRRSARALHAIADRLEGDDPAARRRARVAAAANLFYALGALTVRGLVLPRALPGAPSSADASMLLAPGDACRSLAEEIDRLVGRMGDGAQPSPADVARLVDRFEECWDHVTHEGERHGLREGSP